MSLFHRLALVGLLALAPALRAVPPAAEIKKIFDALDTTQNDAIGLTEWEQASFVLFKTTDKNHDNYLTRDELAPGAHSAETFLTADADQNGKLSIGEYMNLRRAIFRAADINRDDYLVLFEYEIFTLLAEFGWHDRNHNGRLDPFELKAALAHAFEQLDADHDNLLSPAESPFLTTEHRAAMEKAGAGKLTAEAFIAGYMHLLTG